jgi:hypothetical protein
MASAFSRADRVWRSAEEGILCRDEQDKWQANHFAVTYFITNYSGGKSSENGGMHEYAPGKRTFTENPHERE